MIREAISKLIDGVSLTEEEAEGVMEEIMSGKSTPAQVGSFLTALRIKGETPREVAGCAKAMRVSAIRISPKVPEAIDTCGTGGDGLHTFNVSTTAAFVLAGCGLSVAKHGNRSISSKSGSADVLEALGVRIDLAPGDVGRCIEETGIGFLYAPVFHPAMKHASGPRKELGVRTVFNILGPLTNPAQACYQLVGAYKAGLTAVMAEALVRMGTKRAMVVHGGDGMDEISLTGPTMVSEVMDGAVETYEVLPSDFGLEPCGLGELMGGTAPENGAITLGILEGKDKGPKRDLVLANSAAALKLAGKAHSLKEGVFMALESIGSGAARARLEAMAEFTRSIEDRQVV